MTGALGIGAAFALLLGLFMLPLTFIGLFVGIGVLGFSPFLTSFVFWRNSIRALLGESTSRFRLLDGSLVVLGAALVVLIPVAAQREVRSRVIALSRVQESELSEDTQAEIVLLRWVVRCYGSAPLDPAVEAYEQETDAAKKKRLEVVYRQITDQDIEIHLRKLRSD